MKRYAPALFVVVALAALLWAWEWGPLHRLADPKLIGAWEARIAGAWWAPLAAIFAFVLGGLIAMPLSVMIVVTVMSFGIGPGTLYAYLGCNLSAIAAYWVGRLSGRGLLARFDSKRLRSLEELLRRRGFAAMLALRFSPVGHFTVESIIAGFIPVRFLPFALATLIGTIPEVVILSVFGHQLKRILQSRRAEEALALVAVVALVAFGVWLARRPGRRPEPAAQG